MYPQRQSFFVFGVSKSGYAVAKFLLDKQAVVFVYDDAKGAKVEENIENLVRLGAKRLLEGEIASIHERVDVLVLSPGIPIDHPVAQAFRRARKAVVGEAEIAVRFLRSIVVAVTGTNGKTTTVSMIEKVLNEGGKKAFSCGNVGVPMIACLDREQEIAVAEISSFQMETLNSLCPHIAVVLNVTEDHLNRHYTMENYLFLKAKLLKNLTESECAVLNHDDEAVRSFAERTKAKTVYFSIKNKVNGAYYENRNLYYCGEKILSISELGVDGVHNVQNALATIAVGKLMGVQTECLRKALTEFRGARHRIEKVAVVDGVLYVNDSKGTNVDATKKAVASMKRQTVLLLGGQDKGYEYSGLFHMLSQSNIVHVVVYGENRLRLLETAVKSGYNAVTLCHSFEVAVRVSRLIATSGQAVLLCPASASFDEFSGYEERGDAFVSIVRSFEKDLGAGERFSSFFLEDSMAEKGVDDEG